MKKIIIISILLISVTSCKIYTDVSYKMVCVYPCQEFKYKNSRFFVKDTANKYIFHDSLKLTK